MTKQQADGILGLAGLVLVLAGVVTLWGVGWGLIVGGVSAILRATAPALGTVIRRGEG